MWQVREVYEQAIESTPPDDLPDADVRDMCLRYAALERKLGEVDRARAIFIHASALSNPNSDRVFWAEWKAFEVRHAAPRRAPACPRMHAHARSSSCQALCMCGSSALQPHPAATSLLPALYCPPPLPDLAAFPCHSLPCLA